MVKIIGKFLLVPFMLTSLVLAGEAGAAAPVEESLSGPEYVEQAREANSDVERAMLLKKAGMAFIAADDVKSAAKSFVDAFSLYKGFPDDERVKMAEYVSWDDRFDSANEILLSVLADDPGNTDARIMYAKILSWQSKFEQSLAEAEAVLEVKPGNRDALLVKANSLNWSGQYEASVPIYRELLEREESFDARLGLANALLAIGDIKGARSSSSLLEPALEYQEKEFKSINKRLDRAEKQRRPLLDVQYSYYNDTDFNQVDRYSLGLRFYRGTVRVDLGYLRTDSRDATRNNSADSVRASAYWKPKGSKLGAGAGAGLYRPATSDYSSFLTWHLLVDLETTKGGVGASLSVEPLSDTAELVENGIRYSSAGVYLVRSISERTSLYASLNRNTYSDSNSAVDLVVAPKYVLYTGNPGLSLTYRLRYLDFDKQSGGGYFDPSGFIAHQLVARATYEKGKFYSFAEPYYGHQSFERNTVSTSDFFYGGTVLAGYNATPDLAFEANAEGGNYAVGSAAGFKYYQVGARAIYVF